MERLQEKSTWGAILILAGTMTGRQLSPENADAITTIGVLFVSAIAAGMPEHKG